MGLACQHRNLEQEQGHCVIRNLYMGCQYLFHHLRQVTLYLSRRRTETQSNMDCYQVSFR
jgi:hypothetical protein